MQGEMSGFSNQRTGEHGLKLRSSFQPLHKMQMLRDRRSATGLKLELIRPDVYGPWPVAPL